MYGAYLTMMINIYRCENNSISRQRELRYAWTPTHSGPNFTKNALNSGFNSKMGKKNFLKRFFVLKASKIHNPFPFCMYIHFLKVLIYVKVEKKANFEFAATKKMKKKFGQF